MILGNSGSPLKNYLATSMPHFYTLGNKINENCNATQ